MAAFASRLDIPGTSSVAAFALPDLTEEFVCALIETQLDENEVLVEALFLLFLTTQIKIYLTDTYLVWYTAITRKNGQTFLSPQDQLRYFPASVVACKATQHPLSRFDEEQEMRHGGLIWKIPYTPLTYNY